MVTKKNRLTRKINELSINEGIVLKNEKLAIYKDAQGNLCSYSAVCTHLGCTVSWNELEKSFDCPCHGSRFAGSTGNVINGPANSPLQNKNKQ